MRTPKGPSPKIDRLLKNAADLVTQGSTILAAAKALGATRDSLYGATRKHWQEWHNAKREAESRQRQERRRQAEQVVAFVRETAGTDAILGDVPAYYAMARWADEYCRALGEDLFPPTSESPTLSEVFEGEYIRARLFEHSENTIGLYRVIIRKWRLITGDPAVPEITSSHLALFRDAIGRMEGRDGKLSSPVTVRSGLRHVNTLLSFAGPQDRQNRDALGILEKVPWVKWPRQIMKIPKGVAVEHVEAVYRAADKMRVPRIPGVDTAAWWRALIVLVYNTGLRRRTVFSIRMADVVWDDCSLHLPGERFKSARPQIVPLNQTTMQHLEKLRGPREYLLAWPYRNEYFWTLFNKLQSEAGIAEADRFGLHAMRRQLATTYARESPELAQLALGHTGFSVTKDHYIDPEALRPAVDRLPQPKAFTQA